MSEYEREARRQRLSELRAAGVDPYPARVGSHVRIQQLLSEWESVDAAGLESAPPELAVAGSYVAEPD